MRAGGITGTVRGGSLTVVAHCRQQTCYFDDSGLLRRLDYAFGNLGGGDVTSVTFS